jgi:prepilin-type processing-associated H-X9-DG protein
MQEDLLGYLLGALEPHEMRSVEQFIAENPDARQELDRLEKAMRPLQEADGPVYPPRDLVGRTMQSVFAQIPADAQIGPSSLAETSLAKDSLTKTSVAKDRLSPVPPVRMAEAGEVPQGRRTGPVDWAVAALAAAILVAMLVPGLGRLREMARRNECQSQLQELGTSLTQFVTRDPQQRLPEIAREGAEAFAGMYAVRLADSGLISRPSVRWCPTAEVPTAEVSTSKSDPIRIASADEIRELDVNQLQEVQKTSGGSYAYTLGVIDGTRYQPPRFESRASFAVLADMPVNTVSVNGGLETSASHDGGINVLFEDGSVRFITTAALDSLRDHPLQNHRGDIEAGVNIDDASLAPSWKPPFISVRQR